MGAVPVSCVLVLGENNKPGTASAGAGWPALAVDPWPPQSLTDSAGDEWCRMTINSMCTGSPPTALSYMFMLRLAIPALQRTLASEFFFLLQILFFFCFGKKMKPWLLAGANTVPHGTSAVVG